MSIQWHKSTYKEFIVWSVMEKMIWKPKNVTRHTLLSSQLISAGSTVSTVKWRRRSCILFLSVYPQNSLKLLWFFSEEICPFVGQPHSALQGKGSFIWNKSTFVFPFPLSLVILWRDAFMFRHKVVKVTVNRKVEKSNLLSS